MAFRSRGCPFDSKIGSSGQMTLGTGPIGPSPFRRTAELLSRRAGDGSTFRWMTMRRMVCVIAVLCSCFLAVPARAQQQQEPEDPENEKQFGLWLDQGISKGLSA